LTVLCAAFSAAEARAQTAGTPPMAQHGWYVSVYPVLAWIPVNLGINVDIPPANGDGGGSGSILDSHFDGAFFGAVTGSKGPWRIEGYGIWAAFGGDRIDLPFLKADLDIIYGQGKLGYRVGRDIYATGGVRRVALKYDITLGNLGRFSRTPAVWDPVIGVGWHRVRRFVEWHASFDGGGFGIGADVDLGGSVRVDLKPWSHVGIALGYDVLHLKLSDDHATRTIIVKTTAHGPSFGIGLYF
jgi:hypothetical protein